MEIEKLREEINYLLEKINGHSERFTDKPHIPSLEISVLLAKLNKLYEKATLLKYLLEKDEEEAFRQKRMNKESTASIPSSPPITEEPVIEREEIIETETPEVVIETTSEEIIVETIIEEPAPEPENTIVEEEPQTETEQEETTPPVSSNSDDSSSVGEKYLQTPISKLSDAFSLNDRYLYANELFDKDMSAFNQFVNNIDNCSNLEEANQYITGLKEKPNWDEENDIIGEFVNLIERRFI